MKKATLTGIMIQLAFIKVMAQPGTVIPSPVIKAQSNLAAVGISLPVGEFADTHIAGLSLEYCRSIHRFGIMHKLPKEKTGFIVQGGIHYYFGKSETVASYPYTYGNYFYSYVFGGAIYNVCQKGNIRLTGVPALAVYKGGADFSYGIDFLVSYYISPVIALSPEIIYLKTPKANALWAPGLKAQYIF